MNCRTVAASAALALALALDACGGDGDRTSATAAPTTHRGVPVTGAINYDAPPCPAAGKTVTAAIGDGCDLDGEQMVVAQQDYGGCVIVIWSPDTAGGWGVLGDPVDDTQPSWSEATNDPSFVNPCTG
jgi:hypothetical protein